MPRIEFDGKGNPIPSLALPPFGSETDIPPTVLTFTQNADFSVLDYRNLGFTHFEAWCVGAAGGRGGDASSQLLWVTQTVNKPVPQSVWNLVRERASLQDYIAQRILYNTRSGDPSPYNSYNVPPQLNKVYKAWKYPVFQPGANCWITDVRPDTVDPDYLRWSEIVEREFHKTLLVFGSSQTAATPYWDGQRWFGFTPWTFWQGTYLDLFEAANPSHIMPFTVVQQILLVPSAEGMGGGGGGGGLRHTSGALADLSDSVPVVVGEVGVDAGFGQTIRNGAYQPELADIVNDVFGIYYHKATNQPWPEGRIAEIDNYLTEYLTSYPTDTPHVSFPNPQSGGDGGASSFGDVCEASGGKGGGPGKVWDAPNAKFKLSGVGGAGGIGGRTLAGGGAVGSTQEGVNGVDGVWDPETGIGAGGGGGKGGSPATTTGDPRFGAPTVTTHLATAGGQGSYSFADTSVYGQRQYRQPWTYQRPSYQYSSTGAASLTFTPVTDQNNPIAGGGGGARPASNLKNGSKAPGYSPDGVVVVRLVKIT